MSNRDSKIAVLGVVEVAISQLLYYDRRGDEDVPLNFIENTIMNNDITIQEIEAELCKQLRAGLLQNDPRIGFFIRE